MAVARGKRVRRTVEASREAILQAAERHLAAEGPAGVKVQRIAAELGLTDAAIHYHFGSRKGLLESLLRFTGRRFVDDVERAVAGRGEAEFDLTVVGALLMDLFGRRGSARLAMWLMQSGWSPAGEGMFRPLADRLHASRMRRVRGGEAPDEEDSRRLVALMASVTFAQALSGDAHLRAAGLPDLPEADFLAWVVARLENGGGQGAPSGS